VDLDFVEIRSGLGGSQRRCKEETRFDHGVNADCN
jgi:hypothetical protein